MSATITYIYGTPGMTSVADASLAYVNIRRVEYGGLTYSETLSEDPGDLEFFYTPSEGRITFRHAFATPPPLSNRRDFEQVKITSTI